LLAPLAALVFLDPPFARRALPPRIDAALVLSGDVDYLRLKKAVELYREGQVRLIVLTGAGIGGDSALAMREFAERWLGVPASAMILEARSSTTRENMEFAAPLLRQSNLRQVALVTSSSHMGRALRTARRLVPEVEWLPVPVDDAGPSGRIWRTRLQEWFKLAWYWLRGWA
jgi:uncharacterized SAM-binding protein YcdF (DUF218 family)